MSHCDAFNYWGKGTKVTVSSAAPKPPTVYMMSQYESSSESLIVGCLASGFSPAESVSFKWMEGRKALTDFIQYPTVTTGGKMLKVSHITINKNQNDISCTAVHPSKTVSETFIRVKPQEPTLTLVPVTTQKSTSVMCVIEDFYPEKLTGQWKVNNDNTILKLKRKQNKDGRYTAYSFYQVSSKTWNTNTSYSCEVTHRGKRIIEEKNFKAKFTLMLKPPIERELFVNNKVVLEAVVSGDVQNTVEEASVSCTVKNIPVNSENITKGNVFTDTSNLWIRIHNVTIDKNSWFDGEMVTCTVRDTNNNRDIKQEIHFDKGAKLTLMLKPPIERELFVNNKVVLEAVVSGDVQNTVEEASVSCTVKNIPVNSENITKGNVSTDTPNLWILTHYVTIYNETWFDGENVTCTVRDTNNNRDIKQEIHFDKGDGQKPTVTIHSPETNINVSDSVYLVCEVTSHRLGDVYIMWKVGEKPSIDTRTSAPIHQKSSTSVISILTLSKQEYEDLRTVFTCAVIHANMDDIGSPLEVSISKAKFTLMLKPPIERELFVNNKVVLEAVVSGDVQNTVEEASVSCTVKNIPVNSDNITTGNVFTDTSNLWIRIHNVTIDKNSWFDGEMVTCTVRDTNNNRDIKQEIHFDEGDGQKPTVTIHSPETNINVSDSVYLVCEVTSHKLGDVYIMWKVGEKPSIDTRTSAPIHQKSSTSVISILTLSKQEYEDLQTVFTCAVIHANMDDIGSPLEVSISKAKFTLMLKPPIERELFVNNKVVLEAVVSGDVQNTVQEASVSCTVKNTPVNSDNIIPGNVSTDTSKLWIRIHKVTIDKNTWFDGEMVTCTVRDTNNNRDIKQEIHFDEGDGQKPTVTIHSPETNINVSDSVSLVCEVTSHKLGDVYIMWKVGEEPYIEARTSAPIHQKSSTSVLSILTLSKQEYEDLQTVFTCAVIHANMDAIGSPLEVSTSKAKFTLMLKPPIERELFVNNKVVLEAVVSGDVQNTVQEASVSCTVKNIPVNSDNIIPGNVSTDTSKLWIRIHKVTIDKNSWFDGEMVTCTVRDTNNNRDIKQEIHFDEGDGQKPTVTIYKPDTNINVSDSVSLVCEVTSHKLGDVYIMWKVGEGPYIEARTSAPIHQKISTSVISILTLSKQEYEDLQTVFTCAVIHANMDDIGSPLEVSTSKAKFTLMLKPPIERELFVNNKVVLEAVVSGDVQNTVQEASVSCTVKNIPVNSDNIIPGNVFTGTSNLWIRIHKVTIDKNSWFDGEMVTCTVRDTNNNRDIKQEIHFDEGDGQKPTVTIHSPETNINVSDSVSLVCEVTSHKLGDVYIMWKVGEGPYIEARTSAPIHQKSSTSVLSILTLSKQEYEDLQTVFTCAVIHANMDDIGSPLEVSTSKAKFTLMLKPPIERELFVNNKVVLEAVVSGDVQNTVQEASVSCTVKNTPVNSDNIIPGNVSTDTSKLWIRIHKVTIDKNSWFDGENVTCTVRDTNNNRDIKQEIHFDKGDGQKPTVTIHSPDTNINVSDSVYLVCEVTSHKLGDVYIMWKVGEGPYIEARTSAPIHQKSSTSVLSILTLSKQEYEDLQTVFTCAVIHANMDDIGSPLEVSTSKAKFTLMLKPPIERELFVNNKVVLEAVVSGDVQNTVQEASVSCTVKNTPVNSDNIIPGNVSTDTSNLWIRIHKVTIDKNSWFDGEMVTCTIRDTNNNRDIKQEIHFDEGDGQKPTVTIHSPETNINVSDSVYLVCEVTSHKLGDVYIMWKVGEEPYIEARTSAPIHQKSSTSVLSILTLSKQEYEDLQTVFTCAVIHANMDDIGSPLEVSTSKAKFTLMLKPPIERELFVNNKVVLEAVVSGDVQNTVEEASVSCTVKNIPVNSDNIIPGNVSTDTSNLWIKIHKVTIDKNTWFDGEMVTCTVRDTNNNRDIKQEIHFDEGDGQKPTVTIHSPDTNINVSDSVSLVCEVTSHKLGDVYIMWKVGEEPSIDTRTSAPIHQKSSTSVISILTLSKQEYEDLQTVFTCAVIHANMDDIGSPLEVSTSKGKQEEMSTKITLMLKPPIERELFVNNKVVLEAVVSGDVKNTVQDALVSCTVKNIPVNSDNIIPGNVFTDTSNLWIRIHNVTIDKNTWFDGEMVTCTVRDTNNNRDIKQEIHFDKGDGQKPTVTIHSPDTNINVSDSVSLVCEVTSHKLGDVYIMWKVGEEPYIEARTSAPIHQKSSTSVLSILTLSKQEYEDLQTVFTCAVIHANMDDIGSPLEVSTSKAKFTLMLKPPIERELFVNNKVVLEAVVSGDVQNTVQEASVSCTVKNIPVNSDNIIPGNVLTDTSNLWIKIHKVTIDKNTWFDGEMVTCTVRDTNNNRDIKQEIHFDEGDGQKPTVTIHSPDTNIKVSDSVSLVCEVTSHKLGDVYIMWKVGEEPYIEARTSAPIHQKSSTSVISILTLSKQEYEDLQTVFTCAVIHANMDDIGSPLEVSTSKAKFTLMLKPPIERELFVNNKVVLEAVVSGDVKNTVQEASVSCTVKNTPVNSDNITTGNVSTDTSNLWIRIHKVTIDKNSWFDGEMVTCTVRDTNNNIDIKQEIHFDEGDGQKPTVTIHSPDTNINVSDSVSLVCEVTSHKLGDVYIMWKVGEEPYIEARTSAPIHQKSSTSVISILTLSKQEYEDLQTVFTCAVIHANMDDIGSPLEVSTSKGKQPECRVCDHAKFTLMLKPPIERELFVNNKVVLEAVVSGDVQNTVEEASVSCTVKNTPVNSDNIIPGNVSTDTSNLWIKIHKVTIDKNTWFDGEMVTCTVHDTNNNRDIKQEIHFDEGDGQKPTVTIHSPDTNINVSDSVSLVCEVTSHKLGDVYIMWKVGEEPYIEARTSAPIHQKSSTSVISILTLSKQEYEDLQTVFTCAVIHANMDDIGSPLEVSTSKAKITLMLKPPIERELFVNNKVVLEAVVSGDVQNTVQEASVSCTVKNIPVNSDNIIPGNVFTDTSNLWIRIHKVTIDKNTWFDGEMVTCTVRDTNNTRDIKQEIHFDEGDGQKPTVTIHSPDTNINVSDSVSLVCEVTSHKLGDVYIMWKVGEEPYIEARTSAPIHQKSSTSVISILTLSKQEYEDLQTVFTCAVIHANMDDIGSPLEVSTSKAKFTLMLKPPIERELFVNNKVVLEAVVSGDVQNTVQEASVSCTVKNIPVNSDNIIPGNVFTDTSKLWIRIHKVTIDKNTWFDGEMVTCTVRDTNNNRDIKQEIHFDEGDGQKPTVNIHSPDTNINVSDSVSLVCEVTSHKLGDVYIMWKVGEEPYIEARTSAPIHQKSSTSVISILTLSKQEYEDLQTVITCAVIHANMDDIGSPLEVSTSKTKFTLMLKPPIERELFVNNKVVLEAVVSGDVKNTVEEASVSCTVKNIPVNSDNITTGNVSTDTSNLWIRIHKVTIDKNTWFDGEMVTCTVRDTNNNRDIKQEIHFDEGDGQKPNVTIYKPDANNNVNVSLVCEVTNHKMGDVYIMWKVGEEPYIEARTSAPIHQKSSTSVLSILTLSKQEYEDLQTVITCAVIHANMDDIGSPLEVSTSKREPPEPEKGFALNCNKDVLEEDEFRSLWSTATSFIFLFLFSLTYSALLSLFKMKHS
ncbi:uncharacterized protein LOC120489191 [Pimephales promelas]|uniref:uncharacterized protein LOC120489191 n=1 Tax=Pimephales promelas TaxID=90988 RepID=UPI001955515C|nr:uncharacterized protein LOC120489191 [Pimephales promelas]